MATITINGITLDPLAQAPALSAAHVLATDAAASAYVLVQTRHPLTKEERDALEAKGARILEYVPESTYICRYQPADLTPLRALPFVSWVNAYLQDFKIHPALLPGGLPRATHNLLDSHIQAGSQLDRKSFVVDVVLHRTADASAAVMDKIAAAAGIDAEDLKVSGNKVRLTVPARRLPRLAEIDEVRHVERVSAKKLDNDVARGIVRVDQPSAAGPVIEGDGQIVAVCDTGLDKGSITDVHPAFAGRVLKLYPLGRPGKTNDPDGHGTHVSGSILGDGTSATLGLQIRGTAPKAQLILQSALDSGNGLGGIPADLHTLFQPPYEDGARVHSNSWSNTQGNGEYNTECQELDDFVWNHRDQVICFAAGNEGVDSTGSGRIDPNSIKPPSTAKNCITVGACENDRPSFTLTYGAGWPNDFPAPPIATDKVADNDEGMVAFSSRGPTLDNRIKPDVVAPGTYVLSTRSRASKAKGWQLSDDPLYFFDGGTSMATPLVAGCTAVLREFVITQKDIANPSAALIKALLINGAHPMAGQYPASETGAIPNVNEGFGRVDVAAVTGPLAANQQLVIHDEATALDTGAEEKISIDVPAGASLLKATLVWTDPGGEGLQNDLDLIVRAPNGDERHGNQAGTAATFDRTNNVEQVMWTTVPAGTFEVVVQAFRAAQFPQSYALVVRVE